jgi:hypothetical protein
MSFGAILTPLGIHPKPKSPLRSRCAVRSFRLLGMNVSEKAPMTQNHRSFAEARSFLLHLTYFCAVRYRGGAKSNADKPN